jgi:putative phage-type endonuclease
MNANVLIKTSDMQIDDWRAWRNKGIGGSDAGAIAGVNPWKSPVGVYLEKIGKAEGPEENEKMYWGNVLEEVVADEFSKRTGLRVQRRNAILKHPDHEWMLANVDRLIVDPKNGWGVLECKTASEYVKKEWEEDKVPDHYYLQLQHYMAVTGLSYGYIAVLIGGNKFKFERVDRDEKIIEFLIKLESDFWFNNVLQKIPPAPDGSDDVDEMLKHLYPEAKPETSIEITDPEVIKAYDQLQETKNQAKEIEKEQKRLEQIIKTTMKDTEIAIIGEQKVTWKTVISSRLDTKALKKDHPDIYEKYANESKSRRFSA